MLLLGRLRNGPAAPPPTPLRVASRARSHSHSLLAEPEQGTEELLASLGSAPLRRCSVVAAGSRMMMALDGDDGFHGGPTGGHADEVECVPWERALATGRRLARASACMRLCPIEADEL